MPTKSNCCPSRNSFRPRCHDFVAFGCADLWRIPRTGSGRQIGRGGRALPSAIVRWHMVGRIQRNKARSIASWAYAAHSVDSAKVVAALDRAAAAALGDGDRSEPLRVYLQVSLDGDAERGGVDVAPAGLGRRAVRGRRGAAPGLRIRRADGHPAAGRRPRRRPSRGLPAEHRRVQADYQQRLGLSAGMSGDLEAAVKHGSTCVRVGTALIGPTTANVTLSSHSSHIFITDTRAGSHQKGRAMSTLHKVKAYFGMAPMDDYDDEYYDDDDRPVARLHPRPASASPTTATAATSEPVRWPRRRRRIDGRDDDYDARRLPRRLRRRAAVPPARVRATSRWPPRFGSLRGSTRGALAMDPRRMAMLFERAARCRRSPRCGRRTTARPAPSASASATARR